MNAILQSPLKWPAGWPRTQWRERAKFRTSFSAARDDLLRELRLLGATSVVLSTNVPVNANGMPSARHAPVEDPGVCVYFVLSGEERCIPVDKWDRVHDNLRALQKTIEAIRGIERWGASTLMQAAFQGFAALPSGEPAIAAPAPWWQVLGVRPDSAWSHVKAVYLERIRTAHPDAGGDHEQFLRLQEAFAQAESARR